MDTKIRVPRLRSVLLGMLVMVVFLLWIFHRDSRQSVANQRATGLGAVAGGIDPIDSWSRKAGAIGRLARVSERIMSAPMSDSDELAKPQMMAYLAGAGGGGGGAADADKDEQKKLIRTVNLEFLVKDVRATSLQVQQIVQQLRGEVERADLRTSSDISRSGEISLRIPAHQLEVVVENLRQLAVRVQSEHWESRDITREFSDSEARLRNMKAEEQQYLVLLRRAGSMKDTLEVTEKLSEVRGEIEQLQGELNWWSHQVAMSAVHISLTEEPQATVAARWRPIFNAKNTAHDMLIGVGEWVDWAVAFVINLPLILLWIGSIGGLLWVAWKTLRRVWLRWLKPAPPAPAV